MKYWFYLNNPFETATQNNYHKAVEISTYHNSNLVKKATTEPLIDPLLKRYTPLHTALLEKYGIWKSAGGTQTTQTLSLGQQMALAYAKVDDWDLHVQLKHKKNTEVYKGIFKNGRKPFNSGTTFDKITAYDTLAKNLAKVDAVKDMAAAVAATYKSLYDAYELQQGVVTGVGDASTDVEAARVLAMKMMHRNLGYCIDNFNDRPEFVETLFDLENIRSHTQNHFVVTLKALAKKEVLAHTFLPDDGLHLRCNGNGAISVYLASTPDGTDSTAIVVPANTDKHIKIADFSAADLGLNRHLIVINNGPEEAQLVVDLE